MAIDSASAQRSGELVVVVRGGRRAGVGVMNPWRVGNLEPKTVTVRSRRAGSRSVSNRYLPRMRHGTPPQASEEVYLRRTGPVLSTN